MRSPAPQQQPITLTIAGSDSGGGAGIQADLQAFASQDTFGTSVLTAVTAQHTTGVVSTHVLPVSEVEAQLQAVREDFSLAAAKTGMLANSEIIELVTETAATWTVPLVVDPVMVAASGDRLLDPAAESAYEDLIAHADIVTPNADEATALTGVEVTDPETARDAGEQLLEIGADAALVKGGHLDREPVTDVLVTPDGTQTFDHPRVDTDATHGSGCVLSATLAANLAHGQSVEAAVESATTLMQRAIRYHADVGSGAGAVNSTVELTTQAAKPTTEAAVRRLRDRLTEQRIRPLVPQVGMNIVGAVPAAETPTEIAAIDGRIVRTTAGVRAVGEVQFGASSHTAAVLLGARETAPDLRFAVACRWTDALEEAIHTHEFPHATAGDRATIQATAASAFDVTPRPTVLFYDAGTDAEPICFLLAQDEQTLGDRIETLISEVAEP